MRSSFACCGTKQPKHIQQSRMQLEQQNGKKWRFSDEELFELTKRFQSYATSNHRVSHKNYRESLGIIGIESLSFMCDRMFNSMDKDKDGYIYLHEYLNYLDVLMYGSEEEKLKQSFELLDEEGKGQINLQDFRKIVSSFAQMWSAALGQPTPINPRFIERIFDSLALGKDFFNLQDFMREMRENPDMLFWFSKPESAMNKRVNDYVGQHEMQKKVMREKIDKLRIKFIDYQNELQSKLQNVVEIITGVATPEKSHRGGIIGEKALSQSGGSDRGQVFSFAAPGPIGKVHHQRGDSASLISNPSISNQRENLRIQIDAGSGGEEATSQNKSKVRPLNTNLLAPTTSITNSKLTGMFPLKKQNTFNTKNSLFMNLGGLTEKIEFPETDKKTTVLEREHTAGPLSGLSPKTNPAGNKSGHHLLMMKTVVKKQYNGGSALSQLGGQKKGSLASPFQGISGVRSFDSHKERTQHLKNPSHDNLFHVIHEESYLNNGEHRSTAQLGIEEDSGIINKHSPQYNQHNPSAPVLHFYNTGGGLLYKENSFSGMQFAEIADQNQIIEENEQEEKLGNLGASVVSSVQKKKLAYSSGGLTSQTKKSKKMNNFVVERIVDQGSQKVKSFEADEESKHQSQAEDDFARECFEGGEKEETFHNTSHQSRQHTAEQIQQNNTLNENDIHLGLGNISNGGNNSQLNDSRHSNEYENKSGKQPGLQREITFQRNPMYPGQIFFVDSPAELQIIENRQRHKRSGHQLIEEEDYESYLSSSNGSENESLTNKRKVKKRKFKRIGDIQSPQFEDEQSEDAGDISEYTDGELDPEKLDHEERALLARINALKQYLPKYQQQQQQPNQQDIVNEVIKIEVKPKEATPRVKFEGKASQDVLQNPLGDPTDEINQTSPEPHRIQKGQISNYHGPGKIMQFKSLPTITGDGINPISESRVALRPKPSFQVLPTEKDVSNQHSGQKNEGVTVACQTIELSNTHSIPNELIAQNNQESVNSLALNEQRRKSSQKTKPKIAIHHHSSNQCAGPSSSSPNLKVDISSMLDDDIKKRFSQLNQNEKYLRRINAGRDLINNIVAFMSEAREEIEMEFKVLLNMDAQEKDENNPKKRHEIQVKQNVPKTDIKKNKILKPRPRVLESAKLIHPAHENFNLVCNIMMGIKKAIDSTLDIPLLDITEKEFNIRCKYELAPYRTSAEDNVKACTFYDYAPQVFASIRKTFGIKKDTYSKSLGPDNILGYMFNANFQPLAELISSGKSGSFFYYTSDGKFVLKTISRAEFKFLKRILRDYHQYLTSENSESIISKVFGLHKIIFYRKKTAKMHKKVYFAIMNNVFHTYLKIDKRYDLKGSTQGRETILKPGEAVDPTTALKDLDLLRNKEKFKIDGDVKRRLLDSLKKDVGFFTRCEIIDYSLLVGIHYRNLHLPLTNNSQQYVNSEASADYNSPIPSQQAGHFLMSSYDRYSGTSLMGGPLPFNELCESGIPSIEKSFTYFIGVIDILTEYSTKKKFEHLFKSIKYDGETISCVPPLHKDNMMEIPMQLVRETSENEESDEGKQNGAAGGNTSKFSLQCKEAPLFRPEFGDHENEKLWALMGQYLGRDIKSIQKSIVGHVEYTLAMTRFNFSNFGCMQAVAYSLRDRMIECFNDTNQYYLHNDVKRVYFLSMEYILGRQMQNNLLNNDLETNYREALKDIGYDLTELYEEELDINLGHGVLGRIAADSLDSLVTRNVPCWGYGLRYDYGVFRQELTEEGEQIEVPDYWLERGNPWEIERPDVTYKIRMYGRIIKDNNDKPRWVGGDVMLATAYDMPITGYNTFNTNNLRLWRSRPYDEYEGEEDKADDADLTDDQDYKSQYFQEVEKCQEAEYITSIFYPNDNLQRDKEIRLKQQYFYVAATLQDIFRRFQKQFNVQEHLAQFENKNAIHLHETHSAIAILEMLRILIDEHNINWQAAWNTVNHTFSCGTYNIKDSQMEKWPVDLFGKMLPRHYEIVQLVNKILLEKVKKAFAKDPKLQEKLARITIIDETNKLIRVANLCIVACHKVIFSTQMQFDILTNQDTGIFRDFISILPKKTFTVIPNGGNPRRWIYNANRKLADLISEEIGDEQEWLVDLDHLSSFIRYTDDLDFLKKFLDIRAQNKWRLLKWIKKKTQQEHLNPDSPLKIQDILFDIMVKRVDENKRQLMYLLYTIYRYNQLKNMIDKSQVVPRFHFIGGKTAIGNTKAKQIVKLFNQVSNKINNDPETNSLLRLIFIPNYNASKEHIVVPSVDFNEQISLPGEEACTTISEKFILNGALIIGSQDATNTNVVQCIGKETITIFGMNYSQVKQLKKSHTKEQFAKLVCPELKETINQVLSGDSFGECHPIISEILNGILQGVDPYLIGVDFKDYIKAQEEVDMVFSNKRELCKRIVTTLAKLGNLQIDKSIKDLCDNVWTTPSVEVPKPSLSPKQRVRSWSNLLAMGENRNSQSQEFGSIKDGGEVGSEDGGYVRGNEEVEKAQKELAMVLDQE